jgi:hypothetical protein
MRIIRPAVLTLVVASSLGLGARPDQPRKAFVEDWRGKRVEIRKTLFTLVYNERGRLSNTYRSKREGVLVVTPSAGAYFQFDGRDSEPDIIARDLQEMMDRITELYRRSLTLDIGFFQKIEPLNVVRFPPGGALVVTDVQFDHNRVRFSFRSAAGDVPAGELATSLTIQWPTDLSPSLTERPLIEELVRQFVDDGS